MPGQTLTEVAVEVHADLKKLKPEVVAGSKEAGEKAGEELGEGITRGADGKLRDSRGKFVAAGKSSGQQFGKGFEGGLSGGTFAKVAATMAARFALIGGAAAAAAPGIGQLTAALVPAAGAALALPAAMLSIKAASAVTKVAVMGVGDAISAGFGDDPKKASKALEALTGNARAFAKEAIALRGPLQGIQKSISDRFFLPLLDDVRPLAQLYLPMLRKEASDLAGPLGGLGEQLAESARKGIVFDTVRKVLQQTGLSVIGLRTAVDPLAVSLATLVRDTVGELPKLAFGFGDVAKRIAAYTTKASEQGKITAAFRAGIAVLKDLGSILGNLGSIIGSVYKAATENGNTLLANLRELTAQAAAFFKSAEGSQALQAVFGTLGAFGTALRTSLGAVLPAIADSLQALGPAIAGLAGPASQLIVAVAPLLPLLAGIASTIITALTPAISTVSKYLAENEGIVKGLLIAMVAFRAAMIANAAVTGVQAAGGILKWVKATTIMTNVTKVATVIQYAMGAAVRFALGPIGLIITAIGLFVAAIVYLWKNNETFRSAVIATWNAVKAAVSAVVDWFVGTAWPFLVRVGKGIGDAFVAMWEKGIRPAVQAVVAFWQNVLAPAAQWLYRTILKPAFDAIAWVVKTTMAVVQLYVKVWVTFLKNFVAPAVMWLWKNIIKPAWDGIVSATRVLWNGIKALFTAWVNFVRTKIAPAVTWLWKNVILPAWNGIKSATSTLWSGIGAIFRTIVGFLKKTLVPAFRTAVSGISTAWNKLREAARVPVAFVVNKVINPLIGGFNKVAGAFGTTQIDKIGGFAKGGRIPGPNSNGRDNLLAAVFDAGRSRGMIRIGTGEFVVNTDSTSANEPVLNAINRKRGKVTHNDVDPYLDGYARGGRIGDGIGDFFGKVKNGLSGIGEFITNPAKALSKIAGAALGKIPGGGMFTGVLKGMGRKLIDGAAKWLTDHAGAAIGNGGGAEGWRTKRAIIAGWFPGLNMISGPRPGARTLSGNVSLHSKGLAVDYPAVRALAARIKATYGRNTQELITPWQELNLLRGRPHRYQGAVWNQHNFAGGNAHVHWGADKGGKAVFRDGIAQVARADFGSVTLQRGWNMIENRLGRPEHLSEGNTSGPTRWHPADLEALGQIISREMSAVVGAGNYAAGRSIGLYTRGG